MDSPYKTSDESGKKNMQTLEIERKSSKNIKTKKVYNEMMTIQINAYYVRKE